MRPEITTATHPIHKRDLHFDFSKVDMLQWHGDGFHVTQFFNTQSLLFPTGERFFIRCVRRFRDDVSDPILQSQITGFIGQEAMHSREHEAYNAGLKAIGYKVSPIERQLDSAFRLAERLLHPKTCLAMTVAFEHLTATCAEEILGDDRVLGDSDPEMQDVWRWHSLEEIEHKAVAYDVFQQVAGGGLSGYLRRVITLFTVTLGLMLYVWGDLFWFSYKRKRLFDLRGWGQLFRYLWLKPGVYRRGILRFLLYLKPGFHPWQIDNSIEVTRWQSKYAQPD